jgi:hypothetical protein
VEGLRQDAGFRSAIARHELRSTGESAVALTVAAPLRHDPRTAPPEPVDVFPSEEWYLPLLGAIAASPARQLKMSLTAAALLAFGFVFLHEQAGSRLAGRVLAAPWRALRRRYVRSRAGV